MSCTMLWMGWNCIRFDGEPPLAQHRQVSLMNSLEPVFKLSSVGSGYSGHSPMISLKLHIVAMNSLFTIIREGGS